MTVRFTNSFVLSVVVLIVVATTLAVVALKSLAMRSRDVEVQKTNPRTEALARCHALGARAIDDATCQATWNEDRRRFLNSRQPESR